jgi:FkbH-like protein
MPEDPSDYVAALAAGCFFETASFSAEDVTRTQLYRDNAERERAMASTADLAGFLRDLDMVADSGPLDGFRLPRMAQLLAKTNQFHLTTTRYSETELSAFSSDPAAWVRWFSLRDRIGDHGLISVAILCREGDAMVIDTWAMSCRVFSRGMEEFILLEMLDAASAAGASKLVGRYRPTPKNHPVADLFPRLGFAFDREEEEGSRWVINLPATHLQLTPFIKRHVPREAMEPAAR